MTLPDENALPVISHRQPTDDWLRASAEEALAPELDIVDSHHHFSPHWGGFVPRDFASVSGGHRICASIFVQCGWQYRPTGPEPFRPVGETEAVVRAVREMKSQAGPTGIAAAIVGYADLLLGPEVNAVLEAQLAAGEGRLRGIRNNGARSTSFKHGLLARPMAGLYADPVFRSGFACLARHGLSFDAWVYHTQLEEVRSLAQAFPHVPIVLNHAGGLLGVAEYERLPEMARKEWLAGMRDLSRCENVYVKVGGFGTAVFGFHFASRERPPTSEELAAAWRPIVQDTLELFGPSRCMFESNYPVERASGGYGVIWNAFKRLASQASDCEKELLFSKVASRAYRISV